jgi:hypothetical protein
MEPMTHREFMYSLIPGLEDDLKGAKAALEATKELEHESDENPQSMD